MYRASVSNLEAFRCWENDEALELGWLLQRILGPFEQTSAMKAGEAFHKAMETFRGETEQVASGKYRFDIDCDILLIQPDATELPISRRYGDLIVSGRVDAIFGATVYDHKATEYFDADRLLEGYQWRFYLDILELDRFVWNVFVMRETADPFHYVITDFHPLEQKRYPSLASDCERLAKRYLHFAGQHLPQKAVNELTVTEDDLKFALANRKGDDA